MPAYALLLHALVLQREGLLDVEARRRIMRCVEEYPGLHLRELARGVGMDPNHAKYHLQALEKHGLVSSRHDDGYWRFWPRREGSLAAERIDRRDKTRLSFLRRPVPLHIVLVLLDNEEMTLTELGQHVDVTPSTLHYHLTRLQRAGILQSHRQGRERINRLVEPERLLDLLFRYRPPAALVQGFLEAWEQLEAEWTPRPTRPASQGVSEKGSEKRRKGEEEAARPQKPSS